MKLVQAFKKQTAGRWHIVWRSLNTEGQEDLSSQGVSFVYVGELLNPQQAKARLDKLVASRTWKPDVYLVAKELERCEPIQSQAKETRQFPLRLFALRLEKNYSMSHKSVHSADSD